MASRISILSLLIILFVSCVDPFEFDTSSSESFLVVDGQFTTSRGTHELKLTRTLSFGSKFFDPVSGAEVTLHHNEETEEYHEIEPGIYLLSGDKISGERGEEYFIEIQLNNESYRSVPGIMPLKQVADSAYYKVERDIVFQSNGIERTANVINVYVDTDLSYEGSSNGVFVKWLIDELYLFTDEACSVFDFAITCYVPVSTINQNVKLFGSKDDRIENLMGINVYRKSTFPLVEFHGRHYFNVYQQSITQEAYDYWMKVKAIVSQKGTVFDASPASIRGNIQNVGNVDNKVLGFFELASIDTVRTFIHSFDFKDQVNSTAYCNPIRRFESKPECCDCLDLPGASLERPVWVK